MLSKELVAASTQPLILSLLNVGESYGYELIQSVKSKSGGNLNWSEGMLYPVLHRMEDAGLILSEWKAPDGGRQRKYYQITPAGRDALKTEQTRWNILNQTLQSLWKPILS